MKHHPILFSTPMVQAILEGRKTQTRRLLKIIPRLSANINWTGEHLSKDKESRFFYCPYGKPGDVLWVRETWAPAINEICYKADYTDEVLKEKRNKGLWKPSIHMPKSAARLWLEITDVRVEKVGDISHSDCITEGIIEKPGYNLPFSFRNLWISINGQASWDSNPWVWVISFKHIQKPSNF